MTSMLVSVSDLHGSGNQGVDTYFLRHLGALVQILSGHRHMPLTTIQIPSREKVVGMAEKELPSFSNPLLGHIDHLAPVAVRDQRQ